MQEKEKAPDRDGMASPVAATVEGLAASPVAAFVEDLAARDEFVAPQAGWLQRPASFKDVNGRKLADRLLDRGILSPDVLAERALLGLDLDVEAKALGVGADHVAALHRAALDNLDPDVRAGIERAVRHPKGTGQLDPDHPELLVALEKLGLQQRVVAIEDLQRLFEPEIWRAFLPRGPIRSVDHRSKLGPARDQGGRPTCTAFGSTVVAEALEFLRDRRGGPRDLSEEYLWWFSKNGELITAGGYDCRIALYHHERNGTCPEDLLPYSGQQINSNHAHVPVPDEAIDRARDFRQGRYVELPARDVAAVKRVLESGRCVAFASDTTNWNTGTGVITFPDPLDSQGIGAGHCTTIIGYIDRNDLAAHFEGGHFIVRNSWGGAGSLSHVMGPEYGGHLLMPYGWYRRYTHSAATLGPLQDPEVEEAGRSWRAEYFTNRSLRGLPARVETVPDVEFDWGSSGPFKMRLPGLGERPTPPFDEFSARYTQIRRLRPGWHRFTLAGDDGLRLWVDDRLVINAWKDQARTAHTVEHFVTGGDHVLRVEFYEARGAASVELDVEPVEFQFELFANMHLGGVPAASFADSMTDLEWRHVPPVADGVSAGRFSLRATGRKRFRAGTYRFHARHTGGCRIYVGGALVLDDWLGGNPVGAPVTLTAGTHDVRVEFRHTTTIPAADARAYYRAALAFEWAEEAWHGRVHFDPARRAIADAGWPHTDSIYEGFRTQSLTGEPSFSFDYRLPQPVGTTYAMTDGAEYRLTLGDTRAFGDGIPGGEVMVDASHFSAHFTRRVYVERSGRYEVSLSSDEAFRVTVDGLKVLERRYGGGDPFATEMHLDQGVHDISIEYADSGWGANLSFALTRAEWDVTYYSGRDLATYHSSEQIAGLDRVVDDRPATLGPAEWSARARRQLWLPVGRFRLRARSDDGVRVRFAGRTVIDAWHEQPPTSYVAHVEHSGGPVDVEVDYFQGGGGAALEFDVAPDGFLGEYYRGVELNRAAGHDRRPPIAYRFEPAIDFDWGQSGRLARVGSDRFSARWWGSVELPVGRWAFRLTSDDGVRLFLDDRLIIDRWVDQMATTAEAIVDLAGGRRELRVEYYERTGGAVCRLELERRF